MFFRRMLCALCALALIFGAAQALTGDARADSMPYYITVDITNQLVTVYRTDGDTIARQMLCSTGLNNRTPLGDFVLPKTRKSSERKEWYYFDFYDCYAQYATRILGGVMFHSIPCSKRSQASISARGIREFGFKASHGCIRLRWQDAEFIAKECLAGTKLRIFESGEVNEELRELLMLESYTGEGGQTYERFMGIPEEEGALGRFSTGDVVMDLQYRLRDLGLYDGEVTGRYGSATINAVKLAQKQMGLEQTGVANLDFQQRIYQNDAPTAMNVHLKDGMSGVTVRALQRSLAALLLYEGPEDGVYDVEVADAVEDFQKVYGYARDGEASAELQKAAYYESQKLAAAFDAAGDYTVDRVDGEVEFAQVNAPTGLRLRERASLDSRQVGRLTNGDQVVVLERGKHWSLVRSGEDQGYIKNSYVRFSAQPIELLHYTMEGDARLYVIGNNTKDYYSGAKRPCEVFADYLATDPELENIDDSSYATVMLLSEDSAAALRENPSDDADVSGEVPGGTTVKVRLQGADWSLVSCEGTWGYLKNDHLEFWSDDGVTGEEEPLGEVLYVEVLSAMGDSAAVYEEDMDEAKVLGHLKNGARVEIVSAEDGWCRIRYKGREGYMVADDLNEVREGDLEQET